MPLRNLEQIRAQHALEFNSLVVHGKAQATGQQGGDAIKKIPSMIMGNGLMATLAFSVELKRGGEPKRPGYLAILSAVARHLGSGEIEIVPAHITTAEALLNFLSESSSKTLQLATAESLSWLGYARRFVTPDDEHAGEEDPE
jgi:CRISPR/Cas system CMR-associated protein Cmr5 small subunit